MEINNPITFLPGVGDSFAKRLEKLNIHTIQDLLKHFPTRYDDLSKISTISQLAPDRVACIKAKIINFQNIKTKSSLTLQKATLEDATGETVATWFNQPFLNSVIKRGDEFFFAGKVTQFRNQFALTSPDFEPVREVPLHTGRIIPIYNETRGISSKWLRNKIYFILNCLKIEDPISDSLLPTDFYSQNQSLQQIHFPDTLAHQQQAEKRLAFNELLAINLKSELTKKNWQKRIALPIKIDSVLHKQFLNSLPFLLTPDQKKTIKHISLDIQKTIPMNRLLQGEVGSGKTVVAAAAALHTLKHGLMVVLIAPTQVLANQHFETLTTFLKPFCISPLLLTGQTSKNTSLDTSPFIIGTHAILYRSKLNKYPNLGLVIIDEQHRFGVLERSHFLNSETTPHILTMSATPIPRTIALSQYGHLKISNIKTFPTGRKKIKTFVVPDQKRQKAYEWIQNQIKTGQQAFIVCPFIKISQHETLKGVKAATSEFKRLQLIFPKLKLALLHGRLDAKSKDQVLTDFKNKRSDILVTTPVIEVGIDIKNATIMVIEDASRFGLAQLHQLRGRVGRGEKQSYCFLFSQESDSLPRLKLLEKHHNGLKLSLLDLKLRGAGQLFGTSQSGHLDTQFDYFWDKTLSQLSVRISHKVTNDNPLLAKEILEQLDPQLANLDGLN